MRMIFSLVREEDPHMVSVGGIAAAFAPAVGDAFLANATGAAGDDEVARGGERINCLHVRCSPSRPLLILLVVVQSFVLLLTGERATEVGPADAFTFVAVPGATFSLNKVRPVIAAARLDGLKDAGVSLPLLSRNAGEGELRSTAGARFPPSPRNSGEPTYLLPLPFLLDRRTMARRESAGEATARPPGVRA